MQQAEFYQYETIKLVFQLSFCSGTPIALAENETIEAQISTVELQKVASFDVQIIDREKGLFCLTFNGVLKPADYICNIFFIDGNQRNASPIFELAILPSATMPSTIDNPVSTDTLIKAISTNNANNHYHHDNFYQDNKAILTMAIANKPQQIVLQMKDYIIKNAIENSNNHFDYVATINSVFET